MSAKRLGYANPNVTLAVYSHMFEKTDSKAAEAINAALAGPIAVVVYRHGCQSGANWDLWPRSVPGRNAPKRLASLLGWMRRGAQ